MTIEIRPEPQLAAASRPAIADCDIHHSPKSFKLLYPYMAARWRDHLDMFGQRSRQGNAAGPQYPKGQPDASRRDAWPPGGGRTPAASPISSCRSPSAGRSTTGRWRNGPGRSSG